MTREESLKIFGKNFEQQYAGLSKLILDKGVHQPNRTGIGTIALPHGYIYMRNIENDFPMIKGKKMYPGLAAVEMLWFLSGRTDGAWLRERGLKYWEEWMLTEEKAIEMFGQENHKQWVDTVGKSYGYQYRNFNGVDQVVDVVKSLVFNPFSRRHIINLWNVSDLKEMALPPCVYDYNFQVTQIEHNGFVVDLHMKARSIDYFLGCPYDMMLGAWLLKIMCFWAEQYSRFIFGGEIYYVPRDIHFNIDNLHIYENHVDQVKQYMNNVEENRSNVIYSSVHSKFPIGDITTNICDKKYSDDVNIKNMIDNYLNYVSDVENKPRSAFNLTDESKALIRDSQYGNIKADVAI